MDARANRVAALANAAVYDSPNAASYVDGAPHIKHASLRARYGQLVVRIFDRARSRRAQPRILDLGAGEGSVTMPFLELGGRVVAVDLSTAQVEELRRKSAQHQSRLEVRCQDVMEALEAFRSEGVKFDVVVCNSFLHHVPDYLAMIDRAAGLLEGEGQFFSFQDPMRHDTIGRFSRAFSTGSYLAWRVFKGDLLGGFRRRLRRSRGIYLDIPEDNAEFHATRGGVDQEAIAAMLESSGFHCEILRYFSTQSRLLQPAGAMLGLQNTFAVVAIRSP